MNESRVIFRGLVRGWWIVLLALAVALAIAWWLTERETPVYSAEALLVVTPSSELDSNDELLDAIEALERRTVVATFARLPRAPETKHRAAERMGVEPREIRYYWVGASVVPSTNVIRIEVQGPDAERTAEVANAVSAATRREARRLYRIYSMREMASAEAPRRPVRPDLRRNLAVAAVLGLFAGLTVAVGIELARGAVRGDA